MLDTTGLAPGRHMVYVQGINEDGKPGSVSAAFLNVKAAPGVTPEQPEQPVMPIAIPFRKSGGALDLIDLALAALGVAGLVAARRRRR